MDGDYAFNSTKQNDIFVTYDGTAVTSIVNTFQMGSMPFSITSKFTSGDNSNGISAVNRKENTKTDGKTYNLSGQQVNNSYKGVVIINGKKFFQK